MGGQGQMRLWRRAEERVNRAFADSAVGRYFKVDARDTYFTRELRAGAATFLTMVYIVSVNAAILTASGGPCTVRDCSPRPSTNSSASVLPPGPECKFDGNPGYQGCLARIQKDLVVATAATAVIGSFAMGTVANLPLALAPGMGSNVYFTYNMVGFHGSGRLPYETALAIIMVEGCLFLAISLLGIRSRIARLLPRSIRLASAAGIGLFLAFTGLQSQVGVGLVGPSSSTLVTLTACARTDPATGQCLGGRLQSPTFWLGAVGFLITAMCHARNVKGAMIYGIIFVTLVSWIRGTSVSMFPDTEQGNANFDYFKKVVDFHLIDATAWRISFAGFGRSEVWLALPTLLYVDILETTGSMFSMAEYAGFTDGTGGFEGEYRAFAVDASSTIVGSMLGTTTVTTYIESTAGLREGGRTGVTAIMVAVLFLASLFFAPLFTSVPAWAVGPSLVLVGALMMVVVREVDWAEPKEAVPAFLIMLLMPLTYSIAYGIVAGIGTHIVLHLFDYITAVYRWFDNTKKNTDGKHVLATETEGNTAAIANASV
ncbi:adenine/guanine permease AZG2-like [Zingiber officinale]|uniref:Adenine/guanine permease AZG2 n=1 Tax=Zingiber officinale TaxID=94328 RepID=A0A8J5F6M3_ZINOF|nr:adenine/guanine permease AZG2-like [Zingiber officinale]KAG6479993.1 hypothetical protein ZIOFF_063470 [Zingiber officinale]